MPTDIHPAPQTLSHPGWGTKSRWRLLALAPLVAAASLLFGIASLYVIAVSVLAALATEAALCLLIRRGIKPDKSHTVMLASLLALSLPPHCPWHVAAFGAVMAIAVRQILSTLGHTLWHPVLVSRAVLATAFENDILLEGWHVLKKQYLFRGSLEQAQPFLGNVSWFQAAGSPDAQAWTGPTPAQILADLYHQPAVAGRPATDSLLRLLRDQLVPLTDCLLGTTGGCLGATCVIAILAGGLLLMYRGCVRWTLPAGAVLGALLAAAVLPIPDGSASGSAAWWPIRIYVASHPSLPIGLVMVFYHLFVGEFMFAVFFVASDAASSPAGTRGHLYFGLGIGLLTVVLRFAGFALGPAYWAILIMNTCVPLINRLTGSQEAARAAQRSAASQSNGGRKPFDCAQDRQEAGE